MVRRETLLKTRQVAEALGVSVSAIKRWIDSGRLSASRTVGGHRMVTAAEVLRFARETKLPQDAIESIVEGRRSVAVANIGDERVAVMTSALRRGRSLEVRTLIDEAFADDGSIALADDLIRPAFETIGRDWEAGTLDIFQEHRASRIVEGALIELIQRVSPKELATGDDSLPLAIGAAPEGDLYSIFGLLSELALRELGWEVMNLGSNLPLESLAKAIRAHRPRLTWLSVHFLEDPDRFAREYATFYDAVAPTGVAIVLGGPALSDVLRTRLLYAGFGERLGHLVEFARRLAPRSQENPWNPSRDGSPGLDRPNSH